jgi:hypothetical protein
MVVDQRHTARPDAVCRAEYLGAATGGSRHHIAHRIVEGASRMGDLAQLCRPTRPGPVKEHRHLVSVFLTFRSQRQWLKTRPSASSEPLFGSDTIMIAVFMAPPSSGHEQSNFLTMILTI